MRDREILARVQFYAQDLAALQGEGRRISIATRWSEIPWDADAYFVWWWTWAFLPLLKAWLVGRPVVVTGAFDYRWPEPGQDYVHRPFWQRLLMRLPLRMAEANLFISAAEQRDVVEHLAVTRPVMAMPGVDTDRYVPDPVVQRNRTIFTLAWLEDENAHRKGVFDIVRAAPHVLAQVPDARFVVAGVQGTGYPALTALAEELGVSHAFSWPGRLDDDEKLVAMQTCGVYLQPTIYEGFGLAIAEALSCGAPVVSCPNGAVREVVGDAGLLVQARDPEAIAAAVVRVLRDPDLRDDLGRRARAQAVRVFPLRVRTEAVRGLIDEVLAARPGPWRAVRAATLGRVMPSLSEAVRAGLPYLLLSYAAVQGLAYLVQLLVAWSLSPADFGVVRAVEAVLGVALILGGVGMPSLAVRTIADIADDAQRGAVLGQLARLAAIGGAGVALLVMAVAPRVVPAEAAGYLRQMAPIVALMAVSRTILNYFQGVQRVRELARWQMIVSVLSLGVVAPTVTLYGLPGWIAGRYVGEGLALGAAAYAVRQVLRWPRRLPEHLTARRLAGLGGYIAAGLVLRTALDQVGLLALGWAGQPIETLGHFGLATLLVTVAFLVPGAVVQVFLPRLVQQRSRGEGAGWLVKRLTGLGLAAGLLVAVGGTVWDHLVTGQYHETGRLLQVLALVLPVRAFALACGAQLLVADRNAASALANAGVLVLAALLLPWVASRNGVLAVAGGTVVLETLLGAWLWKLSQRYWVASPATQA